MNKSKILSFKIHFKFKIENLKFIREDIKKKSTSSLPNQAKQI